MTSRRPLAILMLSALASVQGFLSSLTSGPEPDGADRSGHAASHTLNTDFEPIEAHVVLWGIEQSLMARKTGKGYEWDVAVKSGDEFAISMQDYDWADEVLHAQIGRRWLIRSTAARRPCGSTPPA